MAGPGGDSRLSAFLFGSFRGGRARRALGVAQATVLLAGLLLPGFVAGPVAAETRPATASLTVTKVCVPATADTFNLRVDGSTVQSAAVCGTSKTVTVAAGRRHTVSETAAGSTNLSSYTATFSANCPAGAITLAASTTATCTITNTRKTTLTVRKVCSPTTDPGRFNLQIDGSTVLANAACGRSTTVTVTPGVVHTVGETAGSGTSLANYTALVDGNCLADGTITLAVGDAKTCTITNTRIPPATATLTVTKVCLPDDGLNGKFNLRIDGTTRAANASCGGTTGPVTVAVGNHTVSETAGTSTSLSNYTATFDCKDGAGAVFPITTAGVVSLAANGVVVCTITNTRKATLTVTKVCVPDPNGGQFDILVDGVDRGDVSCAARGNRTVRVIALLPNVDHVISEEADGTTNLANYASTFDCASDSNNASSATINLAPGQAGTCTITNTLRSPTLSVAKTDNGPWTIGQTGAQYTITVSNTGTAPTTGTITVTDTLPTGLTLSAAPSGTLWSCPGAVVGGTSFTCTSTTAIAGPGSGTAITVPVTIGATTPTDPATITNTAYAYGGGDPAHATTATAASGPDTLTVTGATLTITKVCDPTTDTGTFAVSVLSNAPNAVAQAVDTLDCITADATHPASTTIALLPGTYTVSEITTPATGYAAVFSGDCNGSPTVTLAAGQSATCTITNTRTPTLTIEKVCDPTPHSGTFTLWISFADIDHAPVVLPNEPCGFTSDPQPLAPGNYVVSERPGGAAPTTNTPVVSDYTTAFSGACAADGKVTLTAGDTKTCTVTNTFNATLTVSKKYNDATTTAVSIKLTCLAGTVTNSPQDASPGTDASFTVTGIPGGGTSCTATEPVIPSGYSEDDDCSPVSLSAGGTASCTITNTLNSGTYTVSKSWSDGSTGTVSIHLSCGDATVTDSPQDASPGNPAQFTVEGFPSDGTSCTATEDVPDGYTADESDCLFATFGPTSLNACTITNTLNEATFTVYKNWSDGGTGSVSVSLDCGPYAVTNSPQDADPYGSAQFTVTGIPTGDSTSCTATEDSVPSGYTSDEGSSCLDVYLDETGDSCTITNTLNEATFTVYKDWSDGSSASALVSLDCGSYPVVGGSQYVDSSTPGSFTVTGIPTEGSASCTATEDQVPDGYTSDEATYCSDISLDNTFGGSCTITNTLNEATFTVYKSWSGGGGSGSVSVSLTCGSYTVVEGSQSTPAQFTVTGIPTGSSASCTATEDPVTDYFSDEATSCTDVFIDASGAECTITNTFNGGCGTVAPTFTLAVYRPTGAYTTGQAVSPTFTSAVYRPVGVYRTIEPVLLAEWSSTWRSFIGLLQTC